MPTGTPYGLRCPSCKRGKWRFEPVIKGCAATGQIEERVTTSAHKGHGNGGSAFHGHRGIVVCHDCGHRWASTHPLSGRIRRSDCTSACCHPVSGRRR